MSANAPREPQAGDYLISGPHWKGVVPERMTKIVSPNNAVLLIGRVLVEGDGDLPTAHALTQQIQVVPLTVREPSHKTFDVALRAGASSKESRVSEELGR